MNKSRATSMTGRLRRFSCDEEGGAYTMSYVMVVPIIILLVCLIIETTLMMSAKLGTVYSAYAGARVASVWSTATTWQQAERKISQAATQAFIPFASGDAAGAPAAGSDAEPGDIDSYIRAYEQFASKPVSQAYIKKKYRNATGSITVTTDGPPAKWDSDIVVTVKYDCPFRIPGIGRLLGTKNTNNKYVFPLTSKATLQNEGPQNESQSLGIGYGQLE